MTSRKTSLYAVRVAILLSVVPVLAFAQSISSGTVTGTVMDPSGAVLSGASVSLRNPVTTYEETVKTEPDGSFHLTNVPQNTYRLTVSAQGFAPDTRQLNVRSTIPISLKIGLALSASNTTVNVEANPALVETDPSAHTNTETSVFSKLPDFGPAAGLSNLINYSTGGTAADANGFFHPLGDHAQVTFVVDGQPISDQQSKVFSTQLPPNALQSMEIITGAPDAQYGDKSSLVVNATTKSGLGRPPFGSFESSWGSFATYAENATLGFGGPKFGNFIAVNSIRSGHFLDTPEYLPLHDIGNNENIFDHLDYQPTGREALHLNLFAARNWFQVPTPTISCARIRNKGY